MNNWGIPSIGIRAVKPISNIKIGWIASENWNAAQTRIRVLNINRVLRSWGYKSSIIDFQRAISENYNVIIVGKAFNEIEFRNIKTLKENGKIIFCDICEDILEFPWVKEILSISDKIICCSYKLEEKIKPINSKICVIEDAWEA